MNNKKTIQELTESKTTHITGMFVVHANEAFLNGATGGGRSENKNITYVKRYWRNIPIPYVASQAWRRWLRNTIIEETGWKESIIEAIEWSSKGNTSQVAGQLNPITYPEDDLFGYMLAKAKDNSKLHKNLRRDRLPEVKLIRTSPFKSSLLSGVPDLIKLNEDEGFVHLKNDHPLPYNTEFYSGELSAVFGLEVYRLGVFENIAANETAKIIAKSSFELDPFVYDENKDVLVKQDHPVYDKGELIYFKNLKSHQDNLTSELLKSLVRLRGGAKLSQFGTDVSPKVIIFCGLKTGNLLFDDILYAISGKPAINLQALKEIITDYADSITTDIYLGIRTGYLANEDEIKEISKVGNTSIVHGTPISVVDDFIKQI